MSASPIAIDDRENLLIVTFFEQATDAQYAEHLAEMDVVMERNRQREGQWAVIIDATRWFRSNANQRRMQSEWMKKHDAMMRLRTAGVVFVIDNSLVRGGLTAVLWLSPLPCAHNVVATFDRACDWCENQLGKPIDRRRVEELRAG